MDASRLCMCVCAFEARMGVRPFGREARYLYVGVGTENRSGDGEGKVTGQDLPG
jgi:hypothetical protein